MINKIDSNDEGQIPQKLPFLEDISWQIDDVYKFSPREMLQRYERGWRYRKMFKSITETEREFIKKLSVKYDSWLDIAIMTFQNPHHKNILTVLTDLNSNLLETNYTYFGGGTVIALDNQEYRWSKDIDFVCAVTSQGYRNLRTFIYEQGIQSLFAPDSKIQAKNPTIDQYGIRFVSHTDEFKIKTEIIAEVRFQLDSPRYPQWSPVPCLSINDCFTSKLLANSDRFMDSSVKSRDLIDLCILRVNNAIPQLAIEKAQNAYEVIRPLKNAIIRFQNQPEWRFHCYKSLQIDENSIPMIINGLDYLAVDLSLNKTLREFKEQNPLF